MSQLISSHRPQIEPFLTVDLRSITVTPVQFEQLCHDNPDLRLELTARGELIVMPPTGSRTGIRNSILTSRVRQWAEREGTGVSFDSSAGFTLPDGAIRSPDASWVRRERWESLTKEDQEGFAPLCPDLVIELRSPTDRLTDIKEKMAEYIENGARLGFLIDPFERRVHIYRPSKDTEVVDDAEGIVGEPELPGFVLSLRDLW
jgi:Uma2 family endonuclease